VASGVNPEDARAATEDARSKGHSVKFSEETGDATYPSPRAKSRYLASEHLVDHNAYY
jgi:hypothetical protein